MNDMALALELQERNAARYAQLMHAAAGLPNDALFARMLAGRFCGVLPPGLGLDAEEYGALLARHFPGQSVGRPLPPAAEPEKDRLDERAELIELLLVHRARVDPSEVWMAGIVAAACMGGDHLWQDLGLASRAELSRLMTDNFPALAAKNVYDMKWKKFLYRQICEREGIPVCPAPSCQVCADYAQCFDSGQ